MEWFTLGPKAIERLRASTERLRARLGTQRAAWRVQAMDEEELGDFVNEVLTLVDESEAILKRVRPEAPRRKPLPNPIESERIVEPKTRVLHAPRKKLPNPFARRRRQTPSERMPAVD